MSEKNPLEQRVMKTLQSLNTLEDIDANPFLLTRLQAQIGEYEENKTGSTSLRFHRRDFRPAVLLLLLAFNILSGVFLFHYHTERRETSLATFAEEYVFNQDLFSTQYSVLSNQ